MPSESGTLRLAEVKELLRSSRVTETDSDWSHVYSSQNFTCVQGVVSSYVIVILWGHCPPLVPTTMLLHKLLTVKSTQVKNIAVYTTVVLHGAYNCSRQITYQNYVSPLVQEVYLSTATCH